MAMAVEASKLNPSAWLVAFSALAERLNALAGRARAPPWWRRLLG